MLDTLSQVLPKHGISPALFMRRSRHAFAPLNLEGKTVLDVGSGIGWASYFAAASGAKRVVSVEPEAAGSRSAMLETAEAIRDELGFRGIVEIVPRTIQEAGLNETFDVVLMVNSINHLNEDACTKLLTDPTAWAFYSDLMGDIAGLCAPAGQLLVTDCTNRNLFGDLGMRSPLTPTIEWEKHQPPQVWARLLSEVGFGNPQIAWTPHARLGILGSLLAAHPALAYVANSHFRLLMTRRSGLNAKRRVGLALEISSRRG